MTEPEILTFGVAEDIKMIDKGLGGGSNPVPPAGATTEVPTPEDRGQAEYYERVMKYMQRYVEPHNVKSRWITEADIEYIKSEGDTMVNLCHIPKGMYGNVAAIAHPQIEEKTPLRFFAMPDGLLIINPVIIKHTRDYVEKEEGCMSYTSEPMKTVQLFHKITVLYQTLEEKEKGKVTLSQMIEEGYSGNLAAIFQHECGHLNGQYIYDEDFAPEKAIFFGEGVVDINEVKKQYNGSN